MIYYRVKADLDGRAKYRYVGSSTRNIKMDGSLVGNELYTPAERNRIANSDKYFEEVIVKKTETYWFFGARFEYGKGPTSYGT